MRETMYGGYTEVVSLRKYKYSINGFFYEHI